MAPKLLDILQVLVRHEVEFIVVGGMAAVFIDDGMSYEDLLDQTDSITVRGMNLHVLQLERLIGVKKRAGRAKDLAALPVLRATLEEQRRKHTQ
jgi:hypothetical protein